MSRIRILVAVLLAQMSVASVNAEITDQDLVDLLGESVAYREVYDQVKSTIANDDREGFAALVHYPFSVLRQKGCCKSEVVDTIENSTEFVEKFDEIVTPDVVKAIREQEFDDMILNCEGFAFPHGAVWIVGYCTSEDEADPCAETVVGIKTINSIALVDKSE